MFCVLKAVLLQFKIYALGKAKLLFDQINEKFSLD